MSRTLRLHFSQEWKDLTRSIKWLDARGEVAVELPLVPTAEEVTESKGLILSVKIPGEALVYDGRCSFTVKGVDVKNPAVSLSAETYMDVEYNETAGKEAANATEPTPSQIEQLQNSIDKVVFSAAEQVQQAQNAQKAAETAAGNANVSAADAETAAGNANTSAATASSSAKEAAAASETAINAALKAELYSSKPPHINEDTGYWMMWDGEKYVSTPFHSSGVYVGEGEMPAGCNVQVDPNGSGLAGLPCAAEVVDSLPTPEARLRGKVILVHTNGEDKAYICVLKGGTYHWIGFLGWSGGEAEGSTAVLGVAILGRMVLGRKEVLGKLDAPVITLVEEIFGKLDAPVIRLESDDEPEDDTQKLDAPVISLVIEKLSTPVVYLETVLEQLLAPVIELKEV